MKKAIFTLLFIFLLFLPSCSDGRRSTQYFTYFDTVVTLDGYFDSEEEFKKASEIVESTLSEYDAIFDIYTHGELKELNKKRSTDISLKLANAIAFGIKAEKVTNGYCNIAMGSVLSLWHEAREADTHYLPDALSLNEASKHTDISEISFSSAGKESVNLTLTDDKMSFDMGAIAKGIVSDVLRERLVDAGFDNLFVNLGGNVMVIGDKDGNGWGVGVQNPYGDGIVEVISVSDACLVTSGSYQRYFEYDGKKYHHIISPDTLYPSELYKSVTVLYKDGAWADALSTALFNMSIEEGKKVLGEFQDIGVMWITADNEYIYYGTLKK